MPDDIGGGVNADVGTDEAQLLRRLIDHVPALLAYWDADRRNLVANEAYRQWFGLGPRTIRGMHIRDVVGEEVYQRALPSVDRVLRGERQRFNRSLVDAEGRLRHVEVNYVPDVLEGSVIGFFALVIDVTDQVEMQSQLDHAQEIALVGSWVYYPKTGEMRWSREMARLLGLDPDDAEVTPEVWLSRIHPDDKQTAESRIRRLFRGEEAGEAHYRLLLPDGSVRWIWSRTAFAVDAEGLVDHVSGTEQDETAERTMTEDLRNSNNRLESANQMLSDTIAMLGHDVGQPIQSTNGFLEFTLDAWDSLDDEQRKDNVQRALGSGIKLRTLVRNILTLMNVESGLLALRPSDVRVADVVDEALATVSLDGDQVDLDVPADVTARVDPFHLRQVVSNLVGNALKYGAPPFRVEARAEEGEVLVRVVDHGPGVPEAFVPQLFERFSRGEGAQEGGDAGTGFGLYIARALVEANRGSLSYLPHESDGAVFEIRLPNATLPGAGTLPPG